MKKNLLFTIVAMLFTVSANAVSSYWIFTAPSGQVLCYSLSTTFPRTAAVGSIQDPDSVAVYGRPTGDIIIPSYINHYGQYIQVTGISSFESQDSVTSISLPESITVISPGTFVNCTALTSINIPSSVTTIYEATFYGCTSLTSINIPDAVTTIEYNAFTGCSALTSINIPNATIAPLAFQDCLGLTTLTIGSGVQEIDPQSFLNCPSLASISVSESNSVYDSRENCNAIIETSTNKLVLGCQNTVIPNTVTSIGPLAFVQCVNLTSLNIPNGVTTIGEAAFMGCSGLSSITLPNTVTSFENNYSIVGGTFYGCSSLSQFVIPDSITIIPHWTFAGCSSLSSITIPDAVTQIEQGAFEGCTSLTKVSIGTGVISSFYDVFLNCPNIDSVYFYASNYPMDSYDRLFDDSNAISFLCLGNNVQNIPTSAFSNLTGLTSLVIGSQLSSIPNYAFYASSHLENITSLNPQPPQLASRSFASLENVNLVVPCGAATAYGNTAWAACNITEQMLYSFDAVTADPNMGEVQIIVMPSCESPQGEILAVANEGYRFAHWSDGNTNAQRTIVVTSDTTFIAYFEADGGTEGIGGIEAVNAKVYAEHGRIVVEGVEGETVSVFDVAGRQVKNSDLHAGVYMVKIGSAPARKVVVTR